MTPDHSLDHNDNQIDRVLNALRDVTPPPCMDRRILNILEAQSSHRGVIPSEAKRSRGIPAFPTARPATFLRWTAGTALVALTVAALITFNTRRQTTPALIAVPSTPTLAPQTPTATSTQPAPTIHRAIAPANPLPPQHAETAELIEDAQVSHPAPPIPLTDQDRILLRYARRARSEDLAQISNDRKAAKDQQEAADFQAFFQTVTIDPITMLGESE